MDKRCVALFAVLASSLSQADFVRVTAIPVENAATTSQQTDKDGYYKIKIDSSPGNLKTPGFWQRIFKDSPPRMIQATLSAKHVNSNTESGQVLLSVDRENKTQSILANISAAGTVRTESLLDINFEIGVRGIPDDIAGLITELHSKLKMLNIWQFVPYGQSIVSIISSGIDAVNGTQSRHWTTTVSFNWRPTGRAPFSLQNTTIVFLTSEEDEDGKKFIERITNQRIVDCDGSYCTRNTTGAPTPIPESISYIALRPEFVEFKKPADFRCGLTRSAYLPLRDKASAEDLTSAESQAQGELSELALIEVELAENGERLRALNALHNITRGRPQLPRGFYDDRQKQLIECISRRITRTLGTESERTKKLLASLDSWHQTASTNAATRADFEKLYIQARALRKEFPHQDGALPLVQFLRQEENELESHLVDLDRQFILTANEAKPIAERLSTTSCARCRTDLQGALYGVLHKDAEQLIREVRLKLNDYVESKANATRLGLQVPNDSFEVDLARITVSATSAAPATSDISALKQLQTDVGAAVGKVATQIEQKKIAIAQLTAPPTNP